VSGETDLYLKIIEPLGHQAKERNDDFIQSYSQMINLFTKEFCGHILHGKWLNRLGQISSLEFSVINH